MRSPFHCILVAIVAASCSTPAPQPSATSPANTMLADMQTKRAESERRVRESRDHIDALITESRKKAGFPPSDDMVGTIARCQELFKKADSELIVCLRASSAQFRNSTEPSETVVNAIVAQCPSEQEAMVRAMWPYCNPERRDAEATIRARIAKYKETLLGVVVKERAGRH